MCQIQVEVNRLKACEPCSGSGAEKGTKPVKCTKCKGTGYSTQQQGPYILSSLCPKCGGKGQSKTDCKSCSGAGSKPERTKISVQVPAGVAHGQSIRMSYQGSVGENGQNPGHLWVHVEVREHPVFQRDEFDVHVYVPIKLSVACLGLRFLVLYLNFRWLCCCSNYDWRS